MDMNVFLVLFSILFFFFLSNESLSNQIGGKLNLLVHTSYSSHHLHGWHEGLHSYTQSRTSKEVPLAAILSFPLYLACLAQVHVTPWSGTEIATPRRRVCICTTHPFLFQARLSPGHWEYPRDTVSQRSSLPPHVPTGRKQNKQNNENRTKIKSQQAPLLLEVSDTTLVIPAVNYSDSLKKPLPGRRSLQTLFPNVSCPTIVIIIINI